MSSVPAVALTHASKEWDLLNDLALKFENRFGKYPTFFVRTPGRVNLIGEHIDYCGYPVLPMAIEKYIILAVAENDEAIIRLSNFEDKYSDFESSVEAISINSSAPQWHQYFLSGVKGLIEHFKVSSSGFEAMVMGTVPPAAGLSSSSALVCAATLASSHVNNLNLSKTELADLCASSERYVGTQGGGMDQAIVFLAEAGTAKLIHFNPLRTVPVKIPSGGSFVVAHSGIEMNKSATSDFNTRVIECRLAAKVLAKKNGLEWKKYIRLHDVQRDAGFDLDDYKKILAEYLHSEPYTREELALFFDLDDSIFAKDCLSLNTQHLKEFKLFDRATHVFGEAARVLNFKNICELEGSLSELGRLMNESHDSCQKLYECSHYKLDELVNTARRAGALGSRLTGAGWGGCTISLVPDEKVEHFLTTVNNEFYSKMPEAPRPIFPSTPGGGAIIFTL